MKRTTGTRVAAVAATLLAAGLATAAPASAVTAHPAASRITGQAQLHASILKAVAQENTACAAGLSTQVLGGRPVGPPIGD